MTATELDHVAHALESLEWFPEASHPTGVLVACENLDTRFAIAHHLETLGYDVWTAGSGQDAYETGRDHPMGIDMLVCDANLRHLSAPELFRRLKARHSGLQCCVMVSGGDRAPANEAARLGAVVLDVHN